MAVNEKKPRLTIQLRPESNKIELFDEYHIDDKIKSTACIPYLEFLFKVLSVTRIYQLSHRILPKASAE